MIDCKKITKEVLAAMDVPALTQLSLASAQSLLSQHQSHHRVWLA